MFNAGLTEIIYILIVMVVTQLYVYKNPQNCMHTKKGKFYCRQVILK